MNEEAPHANSSPCQFRRAPGGRETQEQNVPLVPSLQPRNLWAIWIYRTYIYMHVCVYICVYTFLKYAYTHTLICVYAGVNVCCSPGVYKSLRKLEGMLIFWNWGLEVVVNYYVSSERAGGSVNREPSLQPLEAGFMR